MADPIITHTDPRRIFRVTLDLTAMDAERIIEWLEQVESYLRNFEDWSAFDNSLSQYVFDAIDAVREAEGKAV